jgi:hypothetical protein
MDIFPRLLAPLIAFAALTAASALHAQPDAPVAAPQVTAPPASPVATPSVADQIDNYLKTSPAATLPKDQALGVTGAEEPRAVHGLVDVTVGSNGYRSAFVESDLPLGKTGTLSIAVGETKFDGRAGVYNGGANASRFASGRQSLGLGLSLGDATADPSSLRCRQIGDPDLSVVSRFDGVVPRPCHPADLPSAPQ